MNIYDEKNNGSPALIRNEGFVDQDIEIGDIVTIVAPPIRRMGGWFPHVHVGRSGKVVDYQWRNFNNPADVGKDKKDPYGRVIELFGDIKLRVCVFDDRELRKGLM